MKRVLGIILVFAMSLSVIPAEFAVSQEEEMSKDPRLASALENYEKGHRFMKKGNRNMRVRPGQAQKHFEYAESYFNNAAFEYKELGQKYGIDTSKEVSICKGLSREAHVMISKARRKRKRPGAGY